jgi:hypothetical protein
MNMRSGWFGGLLAAVCLPCAQAQVQVAGTLLVNLDPSGLPLGPAATIPNSGSLGGVFQATGLAEVDQPVIVRVGGAAQGLMFDGHNFMEHAAAAGGALVNLSATPLAGNNAPCSIECWVVNPTTWDGDGETMVYWGVRGSGGNHMAFCYSGNGDHGATDHWGWNLGWSPLPALGAWHHLVYTFDGATQTIYVDGALNRSAGASYNPVSTRPITLAAQRESTGAITGWGGVRGSLTFGKVRVHSGALTSAQVTANYEAEKAAFGMAPAPLTAKPVHRYTFNNAATGDAVGTVVPDAGTPGGAAAIVKGTAGAATAAFTGTKLQLAGGGSDLAAYVDLPNGLISSLSASRGGSGKVTLEGWVIVTGGRSWPRLFDIGSTTAGELEGPGGAGNGANYFMLAQVSTYRDWGRCEINNNGFGGGPNAAVGREFGIANASGGTLGLAHYAVTWDEAAGEVVVYENGVPATRFVTTAKFNHLDDVNVWLGRSNWTADNNLQGDYDEFRVYDRVLTGAEVANDYQAGADVVLVEPGPLQTVRLELARASMMAGTFQQTTVFGDYQNVVNVNVTAAAGIVYSTSDPGRATVSPNGLVTAVGPGTVTVTATLAGKSGSQTIEITPLAATLAHQYSFNDAAGSVTAVDSRGGADAVIHGGPGLDGQQVVLDPLSMSYVQLPAGVIGGMEAVTVEAWASFGSLSDWSRLFDFGDQNDLGQGRTYFLFVPRAPGGWIHSEMHNTTTAQYANRAGALDNQSNVHIALVANPYAGRLEIYINGALAAVNANLTIPLSSINATLNYIGKSLYDVDAYLNGSVDEFRIYNGVLTQSRIAVNSAAGPNTLVADPGALQAVRLGVTTDMPVGVTQQVTVTGDFANVAGVNLLNYGQPAFVSDNPGIVSVTAAGVLKAVSPGTTTITASFGGKSDTKTVHVVILPPVLAHRYSFSDAPGSTTVVDAAGGADWNGMLNGNATLADNALVLDGDPGSYVILPAGIVRGMHAVTFDIWATFRDLANWCRLFDFGDQNTSGNGNSSIFFSPRTGNNGIEMTVFVPGFNDHLALSPILDGRERLHITAVYNPYSSSYKLFYNAQIAGELGGPSVLISQVNDALNYIGHSLFNADPGLNGSIDEFRIYSGTLGPDQIALNDAAGPDRIVTDPGALVSVQFTAPPTLILDQVQQTVLTGNFANVSGVNLFVYDAPTLNSSRTDVCTVTTDGQVRAVGPGTTTLTAVYAGSSYTRTVTVTAPPLALKHRYSFGDAASSSIATDSTGDANGTLNVGATFDGQGQLVLDGLTGYVTLPSPLISTLQNASFEAWVTETGSSDWQRVFDFGTDDGAGLGWSHLFLAARGNPGVRFAAKAGDAPEGALLEAPSPLFLARETYLAVSYNVSAGVASLYIDGTLVDTAPILAPLSTLTDANNWLGRSQYAGDALFAGSYNEFRIWEGSLSPSDIAAHAALGPNALEAEDVRVAISATPSGLVIAWPAANVEFQVISSAQVGPGASWSPTGLTPVRVEDRWQVTVTPSAAARFYRLLK